MTDKAADPLEEKARDWLDRRFSHDARDVKELAILLHEVAEQARLDAENVAAQYKRRAEVAEEGYAKGIEQAREEGRAGAIRAYHLTLDSLGAPPGEWPCNRAKKLVEQARREEAAGWERATGLSWDDLCHNDPTLRRRRVKP